MTAGSTGIPSTPSKAASPVVTLASLLNIIWRRRFLILALTGLGIVAGIIYGVVVTPLHSATAQVRPGITAYTESGGPVREWRLRDVTRFFGRRLYLPSVRRQMGWAEDEGYPIIRADFIPRGSQNIQGGNVVTLQTLATSPDLAHAILEAGIQAFIEFAETDTVSSGLFLTRRGLEIQISQLQNETGQLETERERLNLGIVEKETGLRLIDAEQQRIELELNRIDKQSQFQQEYMEKSEQEARAALTSLAEMDETIAMVKRGEKGFIMQRDSLLVELGEGNVSSWLLTNLFRNDAEAMGTLILSGLAVRTKAFRDQARADSLRYLLSITDYLISDLKIQKDIELETQRAEITAEIGDLTLQRDHDLISQSVELRQEIRSRQAQLRALSPLEKIGHVEATKHPVRPRRLRAIAILGFMGLVGSLVLALIWEYLVSHKDEILAQSADRA